MTQESTLASADGRLWRIRPGRPYPYGAEVVPGGVNFALPSSGATSVTLVLFRPRARRPFAELPFPDECQIGGGYAMTVLGLRPGEFEYGYRVDGPYRPERGERFDPNSVLLDPYARVISGHEEWGRPTDPQALYPYRAKVLAHDDFDWDSDRPPGLPLQDLVVYEVHVRGFTRHPSSGVSAPGTFRGLTEKLPYLRELGVNCLELMPVMEFDECDNPRTNPLTGERLYNYWGYHTLGFFAAKAAYGSTGAAEDAVTELKTLVREAHRAGIEVILDVVFNHTAEGDERGPTLSFRGLDDGVYYLLTPDGSYRNFSGTGNTVNANHPVVRDFILTCLRSWVTEYHVDGFRFDLASILTRDQDGEPMAKPPLLEAIAADPVLRDTKLIAEAWDAAGLYQVGSFPHYGRWSEWNGRFRDAVRRFLRGDEDMSGELAARWVGSADLYERRGPLASVNYVTAHDGFTLRDLFSYDEKHNEANGEDGQDGEVANHSWNCGREGDTDDPEILALRRRLVRDALVVLLTSHGVPMLLAGDEMGRTQLGNNNAYCQDELSWLDWDAAQHYADLLRFTRHLIAFRHAHPALRRDRYALGSAPEGVSFPEVSWHGLRPWEPDWSSANRLLAVALASYPPTSEQRPEPVPDDLVYVAVNAADEAVEPVLPRLPDGMLWHRFVDTAAPSPFDAYEPGREPRLADQSRVWVGPHAAVVLTMGRSKPVSAPSSDPRATSSSTTSEGQP